MNFKWLLAHCLILISGTSFSQQFKADPRNWWVGMKNPELEIMIHAKGVGNYVPKIDYPGITLLKYECPESENYLFVTINIDKTCQKGYMPIRLWDKDKIIVTMLYPLLDRQPGSSERKGYSSEDVVYLLNPDRFANGDSGNDTTSDTKEKLNRTDKNGRHGGDLEGIRQHLDYIRDMGFSALWLTPILTNDMKQYSYHGYSITDFYSVDPRIGSNESYRLFCEEAHSRGLKVIMDQVLNHCGSEHEWMTDPPMTDWINQFQKPYIETNHRKTLQPDPYASPGDLANLEKGWFVPTMPDLNGKNPFLATYLIQNSIWWTEYAGIDGIRMDTYLYPDHELMSQWSNAVLSEYPNLNITGEVWYDQPAVIAYWQKDKINPDGYQSGLPSLFDFPTNYALIKALNSDDSWGSGWTYLYENLALDFLYPHPQDMMVFADNHDMSRIYAQLGEDINKTKLALAYVLTVRGIPEIYYGTEMLMTSPATQDDGLVRSDFPGGWDADTINAFTGQGVSANQKDMMLFLKKILTWRKTATAIHHGKTMHYVPEQGIYVYFRYSDQQTIMVILNKNKSSVKLSLSRFVDMLKNYVSGTDIITGKTISFQKTIELSPMAPMIISCDQRK